MLFKLKQGKQNTTLWLVLVTWALPLWGTGRLDSTQSTKVASEANPIPGPQQISASTTATGCELGLYVSVLLIFFFCFFFLTFFDKITSDDELPQPNPPNEAELTFFFFFFCLLLFKWFGSFEQMRLFLLEKVERRRAEMVDLGVDWEWVRRRVLASGSEGLMGLFLMGLRSLVCCADVELSARTAMARELRTWEIDLITFGERRERQVKEINDGDSHTPNVKSFGLVYYQWQTKWSS